jgi:biopolymer transport protein ExbD
MQKRKPVPSFAGTPELPMSELNTTPLIDVMLVLLIMFIVTVPIATHKVPIDLPQGTSTPREPKIYRLELDSAGRISVNGAPVSDAALPGRLSAIAAEPLSELHLRTHGETPYDRFDRVLAEIKRAGVTQLGMIDNERFVASLG